MSNYCFFTDNIYVSNVWCLSDYMFWDSSKDDVIDPCVKDFADGFTAPRWYLKVMEYILTWMVRLYELILYVDKMG